MKCKDCRFWVENEWECENPKFIYEGDKSQTDALYYNDYEGYMAFFYVGPDFGCIHFEKAK